MHTPFSYEQLYRITDKTSTTWFKLCKYIVHDDGVGWRAGGQAGGRRGAHDTRLKLDTKEIELIIDLYFKNIFFCCLLISILLSLFIYFFGIFFFCLSGRVGGGRG